MSNLSCRRWMSPETCKTSDPFCRRKPFGGLRKLAYQQTTYLQHRRNCRALSMKSSRIRQLDETDGHDLPKEEGVRSARSGKGWAWATPRGFLNRLELISGAGSCWSQLVVVAKFRPRSKRPASQDVVGAAPCRFPPLSGAVQNIHNVALPKP